MEKKYWHNDQKKDFDLIGLGNAIVDIIVNVDDNFLEVNNLKKGSMNLINSNESEVLLEKWYNKVQEVFGITPCGHYGQMEKVSFMNQTEDSRDLKQNLEYGVDHFYDNEDGTY